MLFTPLLPFWEKGLGDEGRLVLDFWRRSAIPPPKIGFFFDSGASIIGNRAEVLQK